MKTISLSSSHAPRIVEAAEMLQTRSNDRAASGALAILSRGLSLLALSGCIALAVTAMHRAGRQPQEPVARRSLAEAVRPAPASPASTKDVRLVYGNPDELRSASATVDVAPPAPVASDAPASSSVSSSIAAVDTDPAPVDAAAAPRGAASSAEPPPIAAGSADLNTASIEQLNGLGAGMIGRTIVRGRPYAAPGDLVERRILTRASFDKIKDRVTVLR